MKISKNIEEQAGLPMFDDPPMTLRKEVNGQISV